MIVLPYKNPTESPTILFLQLSFSSNYHSLTIMPSFSFTTIVNPNVTCLQRTFETLQAHLVALANTIPEDHCDNIIPAGL
jgi:hypothetical protein